MIIITGAAATGKSTAIKLLREKLPKDKYDIHDIDESDKWTNSYEDWRDAKIEYWLRRSVGSNKEGITTILCGIIYPQNINASIYSKEAAPITSVLLDASPKAISDRVQQKFDAIEKSGVEVRNKITDKTSWLNRQIEISQELRSLYDEVEGTTIIDTTSISIDEVSNKIIQALTF